MPPADPIALPGQILAAAVAALALVLAVYQIRDRRNRGMLDAVDKAFFRRQDIRRLAGSAVMWLAALGMLLGLRLQPRGDLNTSRLWVATWLGVLACVVLLLILALRDWLELRRYAFRHIADLTRQREQFLATQRRPSPPESPNEDGDDDRGTP